MGTKRHIPLSLVLTLASIGRQVTGCSRAGWAAVGDLLRCRAQSIDGVSAVQQQTLPASATELAEARAELEHWRRHLIPGDGIVDCVAVDPVRALELALQDLRDEPPAPPAPLARTFNGHPITVVEHKGRQIFFVDEIATALGYASAHSLRTAIQRDWCEEAEEGAEVITLTNGDIKAVQSLRQINDREESSRSNQTDSDGRGGARKLLVLTEAGVNLVCIKTEKPAGRELRRWLAREVLPSIRSTGTYVAPGTPAPGPTPGGRPAPPDPTLIEAVAELRTQLAALQHQVAGLALPPAPAHSSPCLSSPRRPIGRHYPSTVDPSVLKSFCQAWVAWNDGRWATCEDLLPLAVQTGVVDSQELVGRHGQICRLGRILYPRHGEKLDGRQLARWPVVEKGHQRRRYALIQMGS